MACLIDQAIRGVLILFCTLVISFIGLFLHRIFFHPLAKVPGPLAQRVSGLPRLWHCSKGDRHLGEMDTHQKYGSAIRIGPDSVTFSTLSALQTIHAKDSNVFKGDEFYGLLDGGAEGGRSVQMVADNSAHAARRRVLDKGLPSREQALRDIDDLAKNFVQTAAQTARVEECSLTENSLWSSSVDVSMIATWFSFDVISVIAFGESMNMLGSDEYRWVPGCLKSASVFLYWGGYASWVGFWRWFVGTKWPAILRLRTAVDSQIYTELADAQLAKRVTRLNSAEKVEEGGENRTDIFRHLLNAKMYSEYDLRADSSLLIAAGSDANRLTIAATIFYWLKNPATLEKVKEEVRRFSVAEGERVSDATLSSCRYLRACVDETMRLCPPKASSLPREVMQAGIIVDGIYIPKGMTVGTSVYALHHDADIFPEPYVYNPERWLQQPQDRRMQAAFCPFLKGPRACPGKTVAYFAIQLALLRLVREFDIRPSGGKITGGGHHGLPALRRREDEYQFNDWILGFADGPLIDLKLRS